MDRERFDRIATALGSAASRRAGVKTAIAMLAGFGATSAGLDAGASGRRQRASLAGGAALPLGADVDEQRPCGPRAKDNACKTHQECCTGYCRASKTAGKTGRCRCLKAGKRCKKGQTCCGGASCKHGRCKVKHACKATVCASGCAFTSVNAAYAAAADGASIYIGPGVYPTGIEITKSITLGACPGVTGVTLVPDRVQTDLTGNYVIITESSTDTTTKRTVTLTNLALAPTTPGAPDEYLLSCYDAGTVSFTLDGCTATNAKSTFWATGGDHVIAGCTFTGGNTQVYIEPNINTDPVSLTVTGSSFSGATNYAVNLGAEGHASGRLRVSECTFTQNTTSLGYQGDIANRANHSMIVTNSTFTGNAGDSWTTRIHETIAQFSGCTFIDNQEGGIAGWASDITVTDTLIKNGASQESGGGIYLDSGGMNMNVVVAGTTQITGNSAAQAGGGIYVTAANGQIVTVTGTNTSNVFGNAVSDCWLDDAVNSINRQVSCATWT
ncbi:MAG: right-handed parallel beta-helix repeat-containing protein [Thermomicrobiales bacterium]